MRRKMGCLSLRDMGSSADFPESACGMRWQVLTAAGPAGPWSSASACFRIASPWLTCCRYRLPLSSSHEPQALHTAGLSLCSVSFCLKHLSGYFCPSTWGMPPERSSSEALFLTTSHVTFPHPMVSVSGPSRLPPEHLPRSVLRVCVFPRGPWILSTGVHLSSTLEPLPSVGPFV